MSRAANFFKTLGAIFGAISALFGIGYWIVKAINDPYVSSAVNVALRKVWTNVVSHDDGAPVERATDGFRVTLGGSRVEIGRRIDFFFEATSDGRFSLWNRAGSGAVRRIHPQNQAAQPLRAGSGSALKLVARGKPGVETLYVVWTEGPGSHAGASGYPDRNAFLNALEETTGHDFADLLIEFSVELYR